MVSHVPQQQVVGGVLATGHFRRGRRPEVLVPIAAGYQQQFAGRAHLPLVQRLPPQLGEVLRQMSDQRQEPYVTRVTVRYSCTGKWRGKKTEKKKRLKVITVYFYYYYYVVAFSIIKYQVFYCFGTEQIASVYDYWLA